MLLSNGLYIEGLDEDTSLFRQLATNGFWEKHISDFFLSHLTKSDVFLDIGANIGYFTLLVAPIVKEVYAFEPMSLNFKYLEKNVNSNHLKNVQFFKVGLWDSEVKKEILVQPEFAATAHIVREGDLIGYKKEVIQCIPLDSLNLRPTFIKLDIEGAEPWALRGMQDTLIRSRPTIIIEVNRHCLRNYFDVDSYAIWDILATLGYSFEILINRRPITSLEELNKNCPPNGLIDLLAKV